MLKKPVIAIIEDNDDLQEELSFFLKAKGYECWSAANAEEFWKKLHLQKADIFLVDIGLPGEDGFSLIQYLSKLGNFGLIIITARGGKQDYFTGLSLGADLYLVKPVNFAELNEKIEALWERISKYPKTSLMVAPLATEVTETQWTINKSESSLVAPDGKKLIITQQEKELLGMLLNQPNQILSRSFINDCLFKHINNNDVHRVDVIVSRLRKKAKEKMFYLPLKSVFGKGLAFITSE